MKMRITMLIVMSCCAAPVLADAPLADKLPAGSLAYVGWAGRNLPFDGSHAGQLLQEPAAGQIMAALKQLVETLPDKNARHLWAMAGIAWQHPIALTLIDIGPGPKDRPAISAALLIELGKDRAAFAKQLDALLLNAKVRVTEATLGQVTYRTASSDGDLISLGFAGNTFFLTIGERTARTLLSVKPAGSLKTDKAFIANRKDTAGENEQLVWCVDAAKLKVRIEKANPAAAAPGARRNGMAAERARALKIPDALGFGRVSAVSGSVRVVDKGLLTRVRILTPTPHRGLLLPLAGAPLKESDLAAIPDDTIFLGAMNLSPAALYAEILTVARQIDPDAEKKILSGIAEAEKELGISISKDILANLSDTWMLISAPSLGGLGTGTVLTVDAKDPKKLQAAINKIKAHFEKQFGPAGPRRRGPRIETIKHGKHEMLVLHTGAPVAPTLAICGNKLYLALWPQVVAAAADNSGKKPLTRNAAFKALRARMSSKASAVVYIDTPSLVRNIYNIVLIGWTALASEARGFGDAPVSPEGNWLPALPKIEKYLSPEIAAVSSDAKGITLESYGSLPVISNYLTAGMSTIPAAAALLVPAIQKAQGQARQTASKTNLKQIGVAIALYQSDNNNQAPPGLVTLVEKRFIHAQALVSPVSPRPMRTDSKGLPLGKGDYVYIVHGPNTAATLIRAYELPENYRNRGTLVLNVSGAVQWMDMPAFKALLKKTVDAR